ncbi:MAG: ABC transporter ATP-binding protein, partial [Clostridia bacterium]|nr:ABC transporter ATP-binding protein [Clostridia bacterium]
MGVNIADVRASRGFSKKTLLNNINLDIESGDFVLILGGSGAGKTTFIRSIMGDNKPGVSVTGQVMFDNMDLYKNFKMLKHKIGFVPQFPTTRDNDTVYNTICDAAEIKLAGEYSKAEIKQRVDHIIEKMMLTKLTNSLLRELSGGQRKRLEVALQAIGDQKVFILDEPDSGMDVATRVDLMVNLKNCTDKGDVVMVISHAPDDAAHLFTKVIVLAKSPRDDVGRLAFYGDVQNAYSFFGVNTLGDIVKIINAEGGQGRVDEYIDKFEMTRRG